MKIRQILGITLLIIGVIGISFAPGAQFYGAQFSPADRPSSIWEVIFLVVGVAWFFFSAIVKVAMISTKQVSRGFQEIAGASLLCYVLMYVFGGLSTKGTFHFNGLSSLNEFIIWIWTVLWAAADVYYLPFVQKSLRSPTNLP